MKKKIAVLAGDGIGPEVISEAIKVLKVIAAKYNHIFEFEEALIGATAIKKTANPLPDETLNICKKSDAILFGAIGHPDYDNDPSSKIRPEQGLLRLRKELGLYANVRPVKSYKILWNSSPLKNKYLKDVDFIVFRELTGGIYFGDKGRYGSETAYDVCNYSRHEICRIAHLAFQSAQNRKKKVTLIDKANVLETSRLWRETVKTVAQDYRNVKLEFMYVDNAAMQIILNPVNFDIILTENMFGDILTDEASVIAGSLGMLPSASIGGNISLYEPIHGSFPDGTGKNIANPIATILSAAMMLEWSFGLTGESSEISDAISKVLADKIVTPDIKTDRNYTTTDVGNYIVNIIEHSPKKINHEN